MKSVAVAPKIWQITLPTPFAVGPVNTYLIKDEVLTLVDVGPNTSEAHDVLKAAFAELNLTYHDLDQIVLTHHHPDHVGGLAFMPDDIPVIGHWRLKPWLEHDEAFLLNYEAFFKAFGISMGVPKRVVDQMPGIEHYLKYSAPGQLTHAIAEGDQFAGLHGWEIIETPGHAQSHIGLIREKDGAYITGDHLLPRISSNALLEPPYTEEEQRPKSFLNYRESLEKLLNYDLGTVLPGHGEAFTNPKLLIEKRLRRQEDRAQDILKCVTQKPLTAFEIGQHLFPKVYLTQLDLVLSEVTGYLDWLTKRGEVFAENGGGHILFFKKVREGLR